MALTEEGGGIPATMLVSPTGNGGGNNGGFGDSNGWWIILLFIILAANGGWGNNGNNGGGFGGGGGGTGGLYPWLNNSNQINGGFQNALLNDNITEIRTGVTGLSTQLCNCCGDIQMALANGQMNAMQTAFAAQTAMNQGFNGLQSQLASCCCENRLATNDLKYTIATENCADRYASAQNTRDIIDSQTRGTQAILDKLCALELDGKNDRIADLERQLTMANLTASQTAQTAAIQRGQVAEVDALYQRLRDCPVGTMPVYGSQPIFTCPQNNNNGCGCGCNGGNF